MSIMIRLEDIRCLGGISKFILGIPSVTLGDVIGILSRLEDIKYLGGISKFMLGIPSVQ